MDADDAEKKSGYDLLKKALPLFGCFCEICAICEICVPFTLSSGMHPSHANRKRDPSPSSLPLLRPGASARDDEKA
jgi:hypothetical protein